MTTQQAQAGQPEAGTQARPWLALVALLLGVSLIVLEGSIVNVLIPTIVQDLGIDRTSVLWVTSIYSLVFAALLITFGVLSDRIGRKRMFMIGTAIFIAFNLLAGAATNGDMLILARAGEAVGGAMMLPTSMAIINVNFRGPMRAAAFGLWGAVFGGMAAFGPLLGGWLTEVASWRWAFYINIPLGLISLVMVWFIIVESKGTDRKRLDIGGVVMSSLGLGLVVFGLIEGQALGWWTLITTWDLGPVSLRPRSLSRARHARHRHPAAGPIRRVTVPQGQGGQERAHGPVPVPHSALRLRQRRRDPGLAR